MWTDVHMTEITIKESSPVSLAHCKIINETSLSCSQKKKITILNVHIFFCLLWVNFICGWISYDWGNAANRSPSVKVSELNWAYWKSVLCAVIEQRCLFCFADCYERELPWLSSRGSAPSPPLENPSIMCWVSTNWPLLMTSRSLTGECEISVREIKLFLRVLIHCSHPYR